MKPEDVLRLREGHVDIVTPAINEVTNFIKQLRCPSCEGSVISVVNSRNPFKEGSIVPNFLGECTACGVQFEPYTRIQVSMPKY